MKTFLTFLLLSVCASAQSYTVVTATLQDSSGQVWSNASWRTEFAPQPGYNGQYNNQGVPITAAQAGTTDNSGQFYVTLDNNIVVSPGGSAWKFILCPNASVASCNTVNLTIFGPVMNVSSQLNAILTVPIVVASPVIAHAYNDTEVSGSYGTLYINSVDNTLRECLILQCNGGGWVAISASTSNPTFTGTLTVPCVKFNFDASNDSTLCSQGATGHINFLLPTTGGTLLTSGTAGNVSNSGTPLNHQIASWIDATHIQGINPTSNNGWVLTSNGLASDPSFQALPGGGNVSNTGTPLNHQVAVWTNATTIQGISPSSAGNCFMSNGVGSDPTFQTCGGGSSGFPVQTGSQHSLTFSNTTSLTASDGNTFPAGMWSHLQGTFTVNSNVAATNRPPNYLSKTNTGTAGASSSIAEDSVAQQGNISIFSGYACTCAIDAGAGQIVWFAMSSILYGALVNVNPNGTIFGFRWAQGTDTHWQAYVSTSNVAFTAVDTGVTPVAIEFHKFAFAKNSLGGLDYYIDDTKVATISSGATGFPGLTNTYALVEDGLLTNNSDEGVYIQSIRWWMRF